MVHTRDKDQKEGKKIFYFISFFFLQEREREKNFKYTRIKGIMIELNIRKMKLATDLGTQSIILRTIEIGGI